MTFIRCVAVAALVALAGCAVGAVGNAYIDYRADSFGGVNHCLHNTSLPCQ